MGKARRKLRKARDEMNWLRKKTAVCEARDEMDWLCKKTAVYEKTIYNRSVTINALSKSANVCIKITEAYVKKKRFAVNDNNNDNAATSELTTSKGQYKAAKLGGEADN